MSKGELLTKVWGHARQGSSTCELAYEEVPEEILSELLKVPEGNKTFLRKVETTTVVRDRQIGRF